MVDQEGVERVERVEDEEWRKEGWMSPSSIDEREEMKKETDNGQTQLQLIPLGDV